MRFRDSDVETFGLELRHKLHANRKCALSSRLICYSFTPVIDTRERLLLVLPTDNHALINAFETFAGNKDLYVFEFCIGRN